MVSNQITTWHEDLLKCTFRDVSVGSTRYQGAGRPSQYFGIA